MRRQEILLKQNYKPNKVLQRWFCYMSVPNLLWNSANIHKYKSLWGDCSVRIGPVSCIVDISGNGNTKYSMHMSIHQYPSTWRTWRTWHTHTHKAMGNGHWCCACMPFNSLPDYSAFNVSDQIGFPHFVLLKLIVHVRRISHRASVLFLWCVRASKKKKEKKTQ